MTTFQGLDVEVVQQQGNALKAQAQQLDSIVNNINGLIAHLTQIWHGHDAQMFEGWWQACSHSAAKMRFLCETTAPLGAPVVPDV